MPASKPRAAKKGAVSLLPADERATAPRRVQRGIKDIAEGRFEDFDAAGLRNLAGELVADSMKKLSRRKTA
jgi:hypothetical protein